MDNIKPENVIYVSKKPIEKYIDHIVGLLLKNTQEIIIKAWGFENINKVLVIISSRIIEANTTLVETAVLKRKIMTDKGNPETIVKNNTILDIQVTLLKKN